MSHQVFIDEDEIVTVGNEVRPLKPDGHVHVIPRSSFYNHVDNSACGCKPEWDEQNRCEYTGGYAEVQLWIHKSDRELMQ